jgi:hypothetical protein
MPQSVLAARAHLLRPLVRLREQAIQRCYWPNKKTEAVRSRLEAPWVEGGRRCSLTSSCDKTAQKIEQRGSAERSEVWSLGDPGWHVRCFYLS